MVRRSQCSRASVVAVLATAWVAMAASQPQTLSPRVRPRTLNVSTALAPAPVPAPAIAHAPASALGPWDGEELPAELLVSEFLFIGETKTYLFHKRKREGPLSITVTPCTSSVVWSVSLRPDYPADAHAISSNQPPSSTSPGLVAAANGETPLGEFEGKELRSLRLPVGDGGKGMEGGAPPGAYVLRVRALERDSFVQLFASLRHANGAPAAAKGPSNGAGGDGGGDGGGGASSQHHALPRTRLWLRRRRRPGHRLTVRWEPSQVDPHLMRYCLVVNPRRHYSTLCEARGELLSSGPSTRAASPPARRKQRKEEKRSKKDKTKGKARKGSSAGDGPAVADVQSRNDIIIGCVGKRTQYTVSGLKPGLQYRFDLFAVNRRTNLSVPYGRAEMRFDARARPTALRDGRAASVNLKSLDGRAAFRFKVPRPPLSSAPNDVLLYVMPCGGGAVDLRAHLQPPPQTPSNATGFPVPSPALPSAPLKAANSVEVARARVEGYAALRVPAPAPGARLVLRVAAPNAEELRRISSLEVLATTRPDRFPFPTLPAPPRLHEYDSLRRCDSVTVGWLPAGASPGWANASVPVGRSSGASARLRYCVAAREARPRDLEAGRRADQCGLELRMRRAAAAAAVGGEVPVRVCSEQEAHLVVAPPLTSAVAAEVGREKQSGTSTRAAGGAVTTLALRKLRPGRAYTVQLTVQRLPAGRPLSYDLLPVHTKPSCA